MVDNLIANKMQFPCRISIGFDGGDYEDFCLMDCYADRSLHLSGIYRLHFEGQEVRPTRNEKKGKYVAPKCRTLSERRYNLNDYMLHFNYPQ
jgi:hypothetical protein